MRNNSNAPVQFEIFQKDPGVSSFAGRPSKELCINPKEATTTAMNAPSVSAMNAAGASTELIFLFKSSSCAGNVIHTIRLTEPNPSGTYTITGTPGNYHITH